MSEKWSGIVNQLAHNFRGRDPDDPATLAALDGTLARMENVMHRMDENAQPSPPPFPGSPGRA
jgi:hypothetical protein